MTWGRYWPYRLIGLFALGSIVIYLWKPGPGFVLDLLTNLTAVGSAAIAFAAAANVSRRRSEIQAPAGWLWLTAGLGLFALGEIAWAVQEVIIRISNPFPSVADIFWLAGYPFIWLGLITAWHQLKIGLENREIAAIGLIVAAAAGAAALFILIPIVRSRSVPFTEKVLDIAYPLADVLLIVPAVTLALVFGHSLLGRPWRLICLGLILIALADLGFSYATSTDIYWANVSQPANFIDLLWIFGYLTVAAGAFYYDRMLEAS